MKGKQNTERYQRQMLLPELGKSGQERLFAAKVLVVGAGGLGCPVLLYLAAAGVGKLGIVDFDAVALSNLHRQVLYDARDLGKPKAEVAAGKISSAYPDTAVAVYNTRLDTGNALEIISGYDLVVDGSDNFPTRYLVNDACVLLGKPLVYGSVYRFEGQVAVFNHDPDGNAPVSYRDIFPRPPAPEEAPSCAEAGVLGVLPGIIGSLQAAEAIKLATGIGEPLAGRLLTFNSLTNSFFEFALPPNPAAGETAPKNEQEFRAMDYGQFCGMPPARVEEITPERFAHLAGQRHTLIVDVRHAWEQPKLDAFEVVSLPLDRLEDRLGELAGAGRILVFCQAGTRSLKAAGIIQNHFPHQEVFSLAGGIARWTDFRQKGVDE